MKKYIYVLIIMLSSFYSFAQIPNPDFENWTLTNTVLPVGWQPIGLVTKVTPATEGLSAIRFERQNLNSPGAIIYGNPPQGAGDFTGGIPFADRPDSLVANFKYDLPAGDSAWVLFMFKNNGAFISQDMYYITGSNPSSFVRKAFQVNYTSGLTPDSVIIGFTSTDPNKSFVGGYMIIDDVHFTNTSVGVPNGGFESWLTFPDEEPDDWFTSNAGLLTNATLPVTKTTDKYSGTFAARIENVITPNGIGMGYMLSGPQGQNGPLPGFPVSERNSAFNGYFKFLPQNNDTLTIGILMFESGVQVGGGFFQNFATVNSYTPFSTTIYYNGGYTGTPDSATILLLPFQGGSNPHGNSVLYVDSLTISPALPVGIAESNSAQISISNYPNPFGNYTIINYSILETGPVRIKLFDVTGREVVVLFNGNQTAGSHSMKYDSSNLANGIYQLVIETNNSKLDRKVVVQK